MNVGFIGLGKMGSVMSQRILSDGHCLFVNDLNREIVKTFCHTHHVKELSACPKGSLDILITMLPDSDAVEAVLSNPQITHLLKEGGVVIEMSSSDPIRSVTQAQKMGQLKLAYLDAPVSGGVNKAINGNLSILVGGEKAIFDSHLALLSTMGTHIILVGTAGMGHAAKAINNYVSATCTVATVEALRLAESFGIDPHLMNSVLNSSTGKNNTTENKAEQFMLNAKFNSGFSMKLMDKDLQTVYRLAQSQKIEIELGTKLITLWHQTTQKADENTDHTKIYALL